MNNFSNYQAVLLLLTAVLMSSAKTASAAVIYDFVDNGVGDMSPFDGAGIGASDTRNDMGIDVTLTTIDIIGQDGTRTSELSFVHTTNVVGNSDTLGINDDTNPGGYSNDPRDFNPGEGWVFVFDVDIELISIDFSSQGSGADMTFSSTALPSILMQDGQSDDVHDLGGTLVSAGTEITLQMTGLPTADDTGVRINTFTVAAVTVPEPLSMALFSSVAIVWGSVRRIR